MQKQFSVAANSSGKIVIAFTQGGADNPFISGIELYAHYRQGRWRDTLIMPLRKGYEFPKVTERTLAFRERFGLRLSCLADTQVLADTQEPIHESEDEQCNTREPE